MVTRRFTALIFVIGFSLFFGGTAHSQTTAFSYQGRLAELGTPVSGPRIFRFTLFDENGVAIPGTAIEQTLTVTEGVFNASIDFGAVNFPGAERSVEIAVRQSAGDPFTVLDPRQLILAAPYAIRSLSSGDASSLGGVAYTGFVQQDAGGNVSIGGNLSVAGTANYSIVNATTQYNLGGQRVMSVAGNNNLFAGIAAGQFNSSGYDNAFFGTAAGQANITGFENSFFGKSAGLRNTTGSRNSFFGINAGINNTTGADNVFIGAAAGTDNQTGSENTFVGVFAGQKNTAGRNSFFGAGSGQENTTGMNNSFFGYVAGISNQTGRQNSFFGTNAGAFNNADFNSFFGAAAGQSNTTGTNNTFVGSNSGLFNATGSDNSFFGRDAGRSNTASSNSFFGFESGKSNTSGNANTFFGYGSGANNSTACCNSFFGNTVGFNNTTGRSNAFFGNRAGLNNTDGSNNSIFGDNAGVFLAAGANNTFLGFNSGGALTAGSFNVFLGSKADGSNNLINAVAVGSNAFVSANNSVVLGSINGINGATADTNVGIGTTAPQTRLQIRTASGNYGFTQTDGTITVGSYVGSSTSGSTGGWLGTQSNHKLFFFTNNGQPSMTVDPTGNVGVGTIAPGSKLTVAGLIETTAGGVKFPDGTIQTTASAGSVNAILNQTTPQAAANFNIAGNGTIGGTITANTAQVTGNGFVLGSFGIGTNAPRAKLEVTGGNILVDSPGNGIILKSPDANSCRLLTIDNAGAIALTGVVCP